MHIILKDVKNKLDIRGEDLLTRPMAKKIRNVINENLQLYNEDTFNFDFSGIKTADTSFLDELILGILYDIKDKKIENKYIYLSNLNESVIHNASNLFEAKKIPILIFNPDSNDWDLLGKIEMNLLETLKIVIKRNEITTSQLKNYLNISKNSASMKLIKLNKLGLIKREESITSMGREFIYRVLW